MVKAQIHMTETIVVLLIFFIIMFFGIFLYYNYTIKSIKDTGENIQEQKAHTQLQILSSMPEFSCAGFQCLDTTKLVAFKQINKDYTNTFGFKTIIIEQIYPTPISLDFNPKTSELLHHATRECTMKNYPECNKYTLYNNPKPQFTAKLDSSIPVSLYFPSSNKYKIGKITLSYYE